MEIVRGDASFCLRPSDTPAFLNLLNRIIRADALSFMREEKDDSLTSKGTGSSDQKISAAAATPAVTSSNGDKNVNTSFTGAENSHCHSVNQRQVSEAALKECGVKECERCAVGLFRCALQHST